MKLKTSTLFWTFIWCWFMGVTAISIGFGAIFPSMNRIAKPFVCPHGNMDLTTQVYNPYPGNTITQLNWYCVDEASGTKTELGIFPMSLYAGTIYGWLFFGVVFVGMLIQANRGQKLRDDVNRANLEIHSPVSVQTSWEDMEKVRDSLRVHQEELAASNRKLTSAESALSRMKELKELRASNLISETEYEAKRAEILKNL